MTTSEITAPCCFDCRNKYYELNQLNARAFVGISAGSIMRMDISIVTVKGNQSVLCTNAIVTLPW